MHLALGRARAQDARRGRNPDRSRAVWGRSLATSEKGCAMRGRSHRFFSGTRLVCLLVVSVAVLYAYQQFTVPAEPTFVRILPRLPLLFAWGDTRLDTLRLL